MAGAAKQRANKERELRRENVHGSSSGETSSSGKASRSARSHHSEVHSHGSRSIATRSSRRGYDGNKDPESPGRRSPGSRTPEAPTQSPGRRNPASSRVIVDPRNFDISAAGWSTVRGLDVARLPPRTQPTQLGQPLKVAVNVYQVTKMPSKKVYQYEVMVGKGDEKRGLVKRIWESKSVQDALGKGFIFDGNRLAWSSTRIEREVRLVIDMDKEYGRTPKPGKGPDTQRIAIRCTNEVRFDVLGQYLAGKTSFDNSILEAINFLDHLLREYPQINLTPLKRNFFGKNTKREPLGAAVEHIKGAYQSMRIVSAGPNLGRLAVNVDVANGAFWVPSQLPQAAMSLCGRRDINDLVNFLRKGERSPAGEMMKKLRKVHVVAQHRGKGTVDEYCIDRFVWQSAKDHKFDKDGTMVSIYDYFAKAYNVRLQYPDLPLVKATKGKNTVLPMEVLRIPDLQRYNFKLDERQVSTMIKFCATPPQDRLNSIGNALKMLDWPNDQVQAHYGMGISTSMTTVDARVLPAPKVLFGKGEERPGTSGRWKLINCKSFLNVNPAPLKSWGICIVPSARGGKPDRTSVEAFINSFVKIYKSHGGRIENTQPVMQLASGSDVGAWVTSIWNASGNQSQSRPQILMFVLPDKDATTYGRIKRSGECRYGVVTQCVQYAHVQKNQAQYISNVCMKFNAKLGGSTARAVGPKTGGATGIFSVPTVIIGADVSHASPGAQTPSMAAMTMSMDRLAIRYAAACQTNGFRVEMITTDNINSMLKPLFQSWIGNVGGGKFPQRIIYLRDGVSEGQYQHVLEQEVRDMKDLIKTANPSLDIPFVAVTGSKRHHIRFFPETGKGDKNNNPLPGTIVETGCTHPFENDFYLNSHAAIKGTSRPMHYQVLLNEANMSNDELFTLLYEHSYQYMRATTPVSQHPAIYYAHLASNRAVPHDPKWGGSSDGTPTQPQQQSGTGSQGRGGTGSSTEAPLEFEKLMPMPNQGAIQTSMWYI